MPATPKKIEAPEQYIALLTDSIVANESSDYIRCIDYTRMAIQVWRPALSAAKLTIEASLDGTHWVAAATEVDADAALIQLSGVYRYLRVVRDNTTDSISAFLCLELLRW